MSKLTALFYIYLACLAAVLIYTLVPGIWVTDEGQYALMAKSFAVDGQFQIWNGLDETYSPELMIPSMQLVYGNNQVRLYGMSAPLYVILAYPFYLAFGLYGLHLMNVLGFVWVTYLVYRLYVLLFSDERWGILSAVLFSVGSYSLQYSQMILPHMVSAAIVLSSVYLILWCFIRKSEDVLPFFVSGLLSGMAVGVRYPNGGFSLLVMVFIFFYLRGGLRPFLTGFLLSALPLAFYNAYTFGSVIETGYDMPVFPILLILLPVLAFTVLWGDISARFPVVRAVSGWCRRHAFDMLLVLPFLVLFFEPVRLVVVYFVSKVFYMDIMPSGLTPTVLKRALLQSTPYLLLSVIAPFFMRVRGFNRGLVMFISAVALCEPLLFSFTYSHGGSDETLGMRYFLDSLPFILILSVYAMSRVYIPVSGPAVVVSVALSLLLAWGMAWNDQVYSGFLYRLLPVILSVLLLISGLMSFRLRTFSTVFVLLLLLSIAFSSSVAFSDHYLISRWRAESHMAESILLSSLKDDSAFFYYLKEEGLHVEYVKLYKRVRMVVEVIDGGNDTIRLVEFYNSRGVPVYINAMGNMEWANRTYEYAAKNNMSDVNVIYWK